MKDYIGRNVKMVLAVLNHGTFFHILMKIIGKVFGNS